MKKHNWIYVSFGLILLTACGSGDAQEASGDKEPTQNGDGITVTDINGTQTFEEVPKRVVSLEWSYTENLLALGVQPVGVADIENYNKWVDVDAELSGDAVDVGLRTEPNLEAIAELEPDLIITVGNRGENIDEELKAIAPTLLFNPYPEEGEGLSQYEEMEQTFKEMAKVLDATEQAESVLADLEATYANAESEIDDLGLSTKDFALTMAYSDNQAPVFRLSTPNAMAVTVLENMGLNNVYDPGNFELYGFSTVGVEELTKVEDANLIHIVQDDDNVFEQQLADNAVWTDLTFTKENRVYALGGDAWPYGGPLSAKTLVERTLEALNE
ncbi:ABC transporter substrate-binding protein [Shouchella patagoniensis]|uniref:ABC transporter substrate-binding protein n=1 Tax=Shouchella patagoniensis TaxID=228576 RepID=UPI00099499FA|nr:iron-siderophore ABC transporter substrate-binding protein [Shouchella patagoniensis]